MKYCNNCKLMVEPKKDFNLCAFLILALVWSFWIYIIYYVLKSKKCPMCNSTNWGVRPVMETVQQQIEEDIFCPNCRIRINESYDYCIGCGKKI